MTGIVRYIPWVLCAATAVWFALMARKAGRNWFSWGLAGAVFGLIATTIVLGVGHAMYNPFSDQDRTTHNIKMTVAAILVIAALGWVITMSLHRHHLALWHRVAKTPPSPLPASTPPAANPVKPKPEIPKQTSSQQ